MIFYESQNLRGGNPEGRKDIIFSLRNFNVITANPILFRYFNDLGYDVTNLDGDMSLVKSEKEEFSFKYITDPFTCVFFCSHKHTNETLDCDYEVTNVESDEYYKKLEKIVNELVNLLNVKNSADRVVCRPNL